MELKRINTFLYLAVAVILLLCLFRMPFGYYIFVRFAATIAFCYFAYLAKKEENNIRMLVFVVLAILFQPLGKIPLGRALWNVVDVAVAGYLLWLSFIIRGVKKNLATDRNLRDTCQNDCNTLQCKKESLPPESIYIQAKEINAAIEDYVSNDKSYTSLLDDCLPLLFQIRKILGKKSPYYLQYSTLVGQLVITRIIEAINEKQDRLIEEYQFNLKCKNLLGGRYMDTIQLSLTIARKGLEETLYDAWSAIRQLDKLSFEKSFIKDRYIPNRATIKKLCQRMNVHMEHTNMIYDPQRRFKTFFII